MKKIPPEKKRPADINRLAHSIVQDSVAEPEAEVPSETAPRVIKPPEPEKDPAAVELGRRGGRKGGLMRAAGLTPEQRSEAARNAARARWDRQKRRSTRRP